MTAYQDKYQAHECGCTFVRRCTRHFNLESRVKELEEELRLTKSHHTARFVVEQAERVRRLEEALTECARVAMSAKLPPEYRWGNDAMHSFQFGIIRAHYAVKAYVEALLAPQPSSEAQRL